MRIVVLALVLASGLAGCGPEPPGAAPEPPAAPTPAGPRVGELEDGESGRVAASAIYRDAEGRLWVDAEAPLLPRGDAADPRGSARVVSAWGHLQLGLDFTDPTHLRPRARPEAGRWVEAIDLAALVGRLRSNGPGAAGPESAPPPREHWGRGGAARAD